MSIRIIALIGFGEVGQTLGTDLDKFELAAFDILFDDLMSEPSRAIASTSVHKSNSATDAVSDCELVISAVTAAEDINAAQSTVDGLEPGTWFLDLNSVSPATRRHSAGIIEAAGGRYVEGAVMAPIAPKRIATSILLGGPHSRSFEPVAHAIGFTGAAAYDREIGRASAAKLCRSIVVKGLESLVTESLMTARHYGVEATVLESLDNLFTTADWSSFAHYLISRSVQHGERRAAEMREAAATVADAGIEAMMSNACAVRQERTAELADPSKTEDLIELLDLLRDASK